MRIFNYDSELQLARRLASGAVLTGHGFHEQTFTESDGGTLARDVVPYAVPGVDQLAVRAAGRGTDICLPPGAVAGAIWLNYRI